MANTSFYSLDGATTALNNTLFKSYSRADFLRMRSADVDVQTIDRSDRSPVFTGRTRKSRTVIVDHEIIDSANYETARMQLRALYSPRNGAQLLVFVENGVQKQAYVKLVRLLPHESGVKRYFAQGEWLLLSTSYPAASASTEAAASKSASPATVSVANAGTEPSHVVQYTFKPTAAKSAGNGQRYMLQVTVANRTPRDLPQHSIEVTAGGWDHAAEVTATRSQADGDDVEVYRQGLRMMRWFGPSTAAANQATTKVWIADDLPAAQGWLHSGAASFGAGDLTFRTTTPVTGLPPMPFPALWSDGTEVVMVTAVSRLTETEADLTISRGARSTSATTHAAGTTLYAAIGYDILYGGTSIAAPDYIDDAYKPIPAESAASGNAAWTFAQYQETLASGDTQSRKPRPNSWQTARRPNPDWTGRDDMYRNWLPYTGGITTDVNPCTIMAISYRQAGAKALHPLVDRWELVFGIPVSELTFTEVTSTLTHPGPPYEGRMSVYGYGHDGSEEVLASYDGNASTSHTLNPSPNIIAAAFAIRPYDEKSAEDNPGFGTNISAAEPADGDGFTIAAGLVATFSTSESLLVKVSARQNAYQLGRPDAPATWANTLGETLSFYGLPMLLNATLTIDVDLHTAVIDSDNRGVAHVLRGTWPTVPVGTTNMTYTETGVGTVDIGVPAYRSLWS